MLQKDAKLQTILNIYDFGGKGIYTKILPPKSILCMQKEGNIVNGMGIYGLSYCGEIMEKILNQILKHVLTMRNVISKKG